MAYMQNDMLALPEVKRIQAQLAERRGDVHGAIKQIAEARRMEN